MPVFYLKNDNNKRFLSQLYEEEKKCPEKDFSYKVYILFKGKKLINDAKDIVCTQAKAIKT